MAGISDEQVITVRSWIGDEWDALDGQGDISDRYDKFFAVTEDPATALYFTVLEIMRTQLSQMVLDQAGSVSGEGMSISWTTNITTLRERLKDLETAKNLESAPAVSVTRLVRSNPR